VGEPYEELPVRRYEHGRFQAAADPVIREARVELVVNGGQLRLALLCLPRELEALAVGFLRGEGVLRRRQELRAVRVAADGSAVEVEGDFAPDALEAVRRRWTWGTACGGGGTGARLDRSALAPLGAGPVVAAAELLELMRAFQDRTELWRRTGGVHACALARPGELVLLAEDVGRHNAFDKVVGRALLEDVPLDDKLVLTTGRLSAEIVSKAVTAGAGLLVSRGAPTALAVRLGSRFGATLVGFARAGRLNVYCGFHRVTGAGAPASTAP